MYVVYESSAGQNPKRSGVILPVLLAVLIPVLTQFFATGRAIAAAGNDEKRPSEFSGLFKPEVTKTPYYQTCVHTYTNIQLAVSNFGVIGSESGSWLDCETGESAVSCEFPAGTRQDYLYAASLWIGAIVGKDTLVTAGSEGWRYLYEMWPCAQPGCGLTRRSNRPSDVDYDPDALSDLDYTAVYTDTLVDHRWTGTDWKGQPHDPLNIEVTQRSFSWSVDYAQDFVLVDFSIKNIGRQKLEQVYAGIYVDGDVSHISNQTGGQLDDICGFKETIPSRAGHGFLDTIDLAWIADNDGDPESAEEFGATSVRAATGVRVMRTPLRDAKVSFNWWNSNPDVRFDWGPMMEATRRNYGSGGIGTPEGDRNKYYVMSNGEHDYDQIFAGRSFQDVGWLPANTWIGTQMALGGDTRYVLTVGPMEISPYDSVPFTIGYVAGELFHRRAEDFETLMVNQYNPEAFYSTLNFDDIGENCVWASWVYDNPGVDTDGDGIAGSFWEIADTLSDSTIVIDTFYYTGDGVPDFRAATAPPPPILRFATTRSAIRLRWNGLVTETSIDPFTRERDFEGYRVYLARLRRLSDFALITSHDFVDYKRFRWDTDRSEWVCRELPFLLDSLVEYYGKGFNPEDYPCDQPAVGLVEDSSVYCFEAVDWNQYFSDPRGVKKRFADEIDDGSVTPDPDSTIAENWTWEVDVHTGDSVPYHKYYEYELSLDNLLPSVAWHIAVTAFDFGDFQTGLGAMESSPLANAVEFWPIDDAAAVLKRGLEVHVYPNPYIGDGGYASAGYEDPYKSGFVDHERRIHFVNLPRKCTISIFTVSGDLVRTLTHPGRQSDADSKLTWNMRSSNNELVTSGIYLYSVEADSGTQIGKIVIIL